MNPLGTHRWTESMPSIPGRGRFKAPPRRPRSHQKNERRSHWKLNSERESSAGLALWLALLELDPANSVGRGDATRYDA